MQGLMREEQERSMAIKQSSSPGTMLCLCNLVCFNYSSDVSFPVAVQTFGGLVQKCIVFHELRLEMSADCRADPNRHDYHRT